MPGVVREIHIKKDCGHWFVNFTTEFEIEAPEMKALDVGIDVGVVHAVTTSDGRFSISTRRKFARSRGALLC